jgi:putative ABC transport system substrate-binding protein
MIVRLTVSIAFLLSLWPCLAFAEGVAVLISREIEPYVQMVEGVEDVLALQPVERFFLDDQGLPFSLSAAQKTLDGGDYSTIVAVGPEAMMYLKGKVENTPLAYGMVLNPWELFEQRRSLFCGVSLNLPIAGQLSAIRNYFPEVGKLGVFYDPQNNQDWFERAAVLAREVDLELVPLQVRKASSQLQIVGDLDLPEAILFIPDKSIISKAIVQYVIREAYQRGKPVIGFNRFFYNSGAALSFIVDYERIGMQVGELVQSIAENGGCEFAIPPEFSARMNPDAWRVLALPDPISDNSGGEGE